MHIAPSSGHIALNFNMHFKLFKGRLRLFSDVWSENATLFERLMGIHSNSQILYYGIDKRLFLTTAKLVRCLSYVATTNVCKVDTSNRNHIKRSR